MINVIRQKKSHLAVLNGWIEWKIFLLNMSACFIFFKLNMSHLCIQHWVEYYIPIQGIQYGFNHGRGLFKRFSNGALQGDAFC